MKRMRIVGLCVVALFALGAFAASSAFALPEYGVCKAKAETGKFKDPNCTKKAGSLKSEKSFEFFKYIPNGAGEEAKETEKAENTYTTEAGGRSFLSTEHGNVIECEHATGAGQIDVDYSGTTKKQLPSKEAENVLTTFTECKEAGKNCSNAGVGEIITFELYGPIGYIKNKLATEGEPPEIGQELKPMVSASKNPKKRFAKFTCAEVGTVEVGEGTNKGHNCLIAPFSAGSVDVMASEAELIFSGVEVGEVREQTPSHFQGVTTLCNLETKLGEGPWEHSVQNGTAKVKETTNLEIKAR